MGRFAFFGPVDESRRGLLTLAEPIVSARACKLDGWQGGEMSWSSETANIAHAIGDAWTLPFVAYFVLTIAVGLIHHFKRKEILGTKAFRAVAVLWFLWTLPIILLGLALNAVLRMALTVLTKTVVISILTFRTAPREVRR